MVLLSGLKDMLIEEPSQDVIILYLISTNIRQ